MPAPTQFQCNAFDASDAAEDPCGIGSVDKADFLSFMGDYLAGTGIVPKEANYNSRPTLNAFDQYSGGDERPSGMPDIHTLARGVRDAISIQHFWTIQIVTAYESKPSHDADNPDKSFHQWFYSPGLVVVGYAYGKGNRGPSVVYTEELRDIAENDPTDIIDEPRRTTIVAAHEAMHRMYGWHRTSVADQNLMKGHYSLASAEFLADRNIQHNLAPTFEQFKFLQSRKRPD